MVSAAVGDKCSRQLWETFYYILHSGTVSQMSAIEHVSARGNVLLLQMWIAFHTPSRGKESIWCAGGNGCSDCIHAWTVGCICDSGIVCRSGSDGARMAEPMSLNTKHTNITHCAVFIDIAAHCQARLVRGWVTVCNFKLCSHYLVI